jgi:hypothetical protein
MQVDFLVCHAFPEPLDKHVIDPAGWLQEKAERAGLTFASKFECRADDHLGKLSDSYAEFLFDIYKSRKEAG